MDTKEEGYLPPYTAAVGPDDDELPRWGLHNHHHHPQNNNGHFHGYRRTMRRRGRRIRAAVLLGVVMFVGYAHWRKAAPPATNIDNGTLLSITKLEADLATCAALKSVPQSAVGAGRARNARVVDGKPATLIRNATVWTGEADPSLSLTPEEIRAGKGLGWTTADVYIEHGLIQRVEASIDVASLRSSSKLVTWDAHGRQLTAGIIDMHSHAGVDSLPELRGNDDTNELSSDITPYVRSKDGIQPLDYQIQVIKSGGVTTSLVLPGSGNNIGGEAFVIKHAVGRHDGRSELSIESLLAAPDAPELRYIKMACGENAKRVYGKSGEHGPTSRLGEAWEFRHAFEQAAAYVQSQNDWCATAEAASAASSSSSPSGSHWSSSLTSYLPRELEWDTLAGVLRGQVFVNTHCYTIPDLESFVGYTNEFHFNVRAFHHAHQTFLVPEVLKRTWGADKFGPPASALFADNMYYKAESQIASEYAGKILWDHGLTPVYVSDNPVLNAQHVLFEAAKAYKYGLPYHAALASVTTAPAERLGLGDRIGKIRPGFDADIAVWDSDPLSVGAASVQVWIDGHAQFDDPVELAKPATAPIVPDTKLASIPEEPVEVEGDVVFTGVTKVLLEGREAAVEDIHTPFTVAVSKGEIVCVGACEEHVAAAKSKSSKSTLVELTNGHLTHAFTAFGSLLGLNEIDAESTTDNGAAGDVFSRAVDGLAFGGTKLSVAHRYGVTRAVSAPKFRGGFTHYGTSAGFLTGAANQLEEGAVFATDAAVHYTLSLAAKHGSTPSISSAVGALRGKLMKATEAKKEDDDKDNDRYSEAAFLRKVVAGDLPLVVTVHSADAIASLLSVKKEVEEVSSSKIHLTVLGGAESHLVADALADAKVGVVLAPLQSYSTSWEQRRALSGAPLTNGTAVDILVGAGVVVGIGLEEDWLLRDLGLLAGIAYHNGGGRLSQKGALALVSSNIDTLLGLKSSSDFIVHEGSPLDINSRVKAVGNGQGKLTVFA